MDRWLSTSFVLKDIYFLSCNATSCRCIDTESQIKIGVIKQKTLLWSRVMLLVWWTFSSTDSDRTKSCKTTQTADNWTVLGEQGSDSWHLAVWCFISSPLAPVIDWPPPPPSPPPSTPLPPLQFVSYLQSTCTPAVRPNEESRATERKPAPTSLVDPKLHSSLED